MEPGAITRGDKRTGSGGPRVQAGIGEGPWT